MTSIAILPRLPATKSFWSGLPLAAALGILLLAIPLTASPSLAAGPTSLRISSSETGLTQHVSVGVNKSLIVDLPTDVREVIVSQPSIVSASMRSKRRAIIQGNTPGDTNIFFLDAKGQQISVLEVSAVKDSSTLSATIARLVPGSAVSVQSFADHVVLSGTVQSADDLNRAAAIAGQFVPDPKNVANIITVSGAQQVMLKVTVAEVSRSAVKQLGISLSASVQGGMSTSFVSPSTLTAGTALTVGFNAANIAVTAALKALETRGAVRTLAEPTLTAISGQAASFHAGGQVPILSGVDAATGVRSFTFKDFGVKLDFTPVVKSNGVIGLTIDTSVSELSDQGFDTGSGIIPAFNERQAKTSVELPSGATLAIGGLIQEKVRQQISGLPGLGNIPILGALFRSRDFQRDQTELIILVTPYMAEINAPVSLPTDRFIVPGDAEAIFLGHLQKMYGVGDQSGPPGQYQGSVGFSLD
jgi:pilus assembly protein CpaC